MTRRPRVLPRRWNETSRCVSQRMSSLWSYSTACRLVFTRLSEQWKLPHVHAAVRLLPHFIRLFTSEATGTFFPLRSSFSRWILRLKSHNMTFLQTDHEIFGGLWNGSWLHKSIPNSVPVINVEFGMDLCNTLPFHKLQCFEKIQRRGSLGVDPFDLYIIVLKKHYLGLLVILMYIGCWYWLASNV